MLESAYDMLRYLFKTLAVTADFSSFFLSSRVQTSCARSAKAHVFFKCSNCMQLLFFFFFFLPSSASPRSYEKTDISLDKIFPNLAL